MENTPILNISGYEPESGSIRILLDVGRRDQLISGLLGRLGRPAALLTRRVVVALGKQDLSRRLWNRGRRGRGRRRRSRSRGRQGVGVVYEGRVGGRRLGRLQGRRVPGRAAVGVRRRRTVLSVAVTVGGGGRELVREGSAVDGLAARGRIGPAKERIIIKDLKKVKKYPNVFSG